MNQIPIVRGFNNRLYFAATTDEGGLVFKLEKESSVDTVSTVKDFKLEGT